MGRLLERKKMKKIEGGQPPGRKKPGGFLVFYGGELENENCQ
ncbi:MAG: hypothetical protein ACUVSK_06475 [Desulfotomaculales bacterium]